MVKRAFAYFRMMLAVQSVAAALNHLLAREAWASARLTPYAGRSVRVVTPLVTIELAVQPDGLVAPITEDKPGQPYDVSITVPLNALFTGLAQGQSALNKSVKIKGDAEFAATLGFLAQHLRWEIEEDLAQVMGDAPATQLIQTVRAGHQQARRTVKHLFETVAEYWLDEDPKLVRQRALSEFTTEVVQLRDALARLEKRLAHAQTNAQANTSQAVSTAPINR